LPTSSEPAVEVVDVVKEYELGELASLQHTIELVRWRLGGPRPKTDTVRALDGVSLTVRPGESVAILGRNGSGKSTLVSLISDVSVPSDGLIRVRGRVMPLLSVGAGFRVELTGRENVMLLGSMLGLRRRDVSDAMDEIAEFAEIARAHLDTPVKRYSSGMRARLSFAASLTLPAEVYILDEVLAAADDGFKERAAQHLERLRDSGAAVIFISHELALLQRICQRGIWLERGRVVREGVIDELAPEYHDYLLELSEIKARNRGLKLDAQELPAP
jgi:ABC-type polysaccharide/polyol phosphate transport system ATPase subunit